MAKITSAQWNPDYDLSTKCLDFLISEVGEVYKQSVWDSKTCPHFKDDLIRHLLYCTVKLNVHDCICVHNS